MMMTLNNNFGRRPAHARAQRVRRIALVALLALLVGAFFWREPLSALVWRALGPVLRMQQGSAEPGLLHDAAVAERDALIIENAELKRLLGRTNGGSRVLAGVLLRPPGTPYDTLVIDAGLREGIVRGDRVSSGGTAFLGLISEVYEHSARVTLYSAPGEAYEGLLNGAVAIVVEGQGGGSLSAKIPAGTPAKAGDTVSLPGVFGGLMATVVAVERAEGDSFATVYLSLPVPVSALRFVEVIAQPHVAN